ncbi:MULTISPECIES: MaoC family dehydratase N-terminal domain-containing protein [Cellulomonas]|uniref:MaoC family dehydratase N-terminal domain-containing protein n=1 Tax=Cellulomonas TaxID=1707 RepID=UPI0006264C20|nr:MULTISPECIES: MaoC family dehydratase N-terminal domain-containing protein [Cellulomonas]MBO9569411.1 MaoC family dehydratase N-terminal domain-containing protein [Cellulomonas iranensis]UCN15596.1 MaoC family dehydratase N-terminal domain-containing protein [Cellulomonas iranensis]
MQVDTSFAGRAYPPGDVYVVAREKLREFAEATGATHPAHTDVAAARALGHPDVVAPPTFAVVIAQRTEAQYVDDPAAGVDFSRVVHADERFTHHRPIHAGDRLLTTLHVDAVTQRAGLSMVTTRCEIADESGAPVATVVSTLAVRPEDAA